MSLTLNVHNWWECSGDVLWAMNLKRSNFAAQGDKSDRRGENQALIIRCETRIVRRCFRHDKYSRAEKV